MDRVDMQLEDVRLACLRRGDGPLMLFIQPFGSCIGMFRDVPEIQAWFDQTTEGFEFVAYDQRGAGESEKPPGQYTWHLLADDAWDLLSALGASGAIVMCMLNSFYTGAILAHAHPDVVRGLVVMEGSARWLSNVDFPWGLSPGAARLPLDQFYAALQASEAVADVMGRYFDLTEHPIREAIDQLLAEADVRDIIRGIIVPTLIVHNELQRLMPIGAAYYLRDSIPHCQALVYRDTQFPSGRITGPIRDFAKEAYACGR